MLTLERTWVDAYGGPHLRSTSNAQSFPNAIMEQSVLHTVKGSTITFYIPTGYTSTAPADITIRGIVSSPSSTPIE
jgi:hypothetical protein